MSGGKAGGGVQGSAYRYIIAFVISGFLFFSYLFVLSAEPFGSSGSQAYPFVRLSSTLPASCPLSRCPSTLICPEGLAQLRTAVVVGFHRWTEDNAYFMSSLSTELPPDTDLFIVYDVTHGSVPEGVLDGAARSLWHVVEVSESILLSRFPWLVERPAYKMFSGNYVMWINVDLAMLEWAQRAEALSKYRYVWWFEGDVRFTGDWSVFFSALQNAAAGVVDPLPVFEFQSISRHRISKGEISDFVSDDARRAQAGFIQGGNQTTILEGSCPFAAVSPCGGTRPPVDQSVKSDAQAKRNNTAPAEQQPADLVAFGPLEPVQDWWQWADSWTNVATERRFSRHGMSFFVGFSHTFLAVFDEMYAEEKSAYIEMALFSIARMCGLETVMLMPPAGSVLSTTGSDDSRRLYERYRQSENQENRNRLLHPVVV